MKTYNVTIGINSFKVKAQNIKEAKQSAQLNKRMNKFKGKTYVKKQND